MYGCLYLNGRYCVCLVPIGVYGCVLYFSLFVLYWYLRSGFGVGVGV